MKKRIMKLGHSPDADDAFMFYAMSAGIARSEIAEFEHVIEDIQSLNNRALNSELELTAISARNYLNVKDRYRVMSCGASMGMGFGPVVVSREPMDSVEGKTVAVPGKLTTAYLLLRLYADGFTPVEMPFDAVTNAVKSGETDCALLIHEGQITYADEGLSLVFDIGVLWKKETSLPLPLGLNVIRRDVPPDIAMEALRLHRESIEFALSNKDEALDYAMKFSRGIDRAFAEKFVLMYVNKYTVDMGNEGLAAIELLYEKAFEKELAEEKIVIDPLRE
ncbi:MAG: ABC transporter substrate-binding protein [Candidatus Mycalebacterium zealandia]|nr:MAG: ABC transporter substrate-binding protein [Candidatus Mycalebacterium zealandia]